MNPMVCRAVLPAILSFAFVALPAFGQDATLGMDMSHMQHQSKHTAGKVAEDKTKPTNAMPVRKDEPPATTMQHMTMASKQQAAHAGRHSQQAGAMSGVDMHAMQMHDGQSPQNARSADYSDGFGYRAMTGMDMSDDKPLGMLLLDRLEYFDGRDGNGEALDAQASYGNDANKLWLKAEGETDTGRLQDLRVEALWDRPLDAFWDTQLGVRHDSGIGPDRSWVAFGVQGLAPCWLEVEATLYVGESGRTAFRFESEYELLLTQRLILQPRFEANLYGRGDPQRGIGSGLSDATLGLRLRYEFTRQFAPYVGVEFERKFGATASFARDAGGPAFDAYLVAGVRAWF